MNHFRPDSFIHRWMTIDMTLSLSDVIDKRRSCLVDNVRLTSCHYDGCLMLWPNTSVNNFSELCVLLNLLLICVFYTIYSLSAYFTQFAPYLHILQNLLLICIFYTIYSLSAYFTQFTPYLCILHNLLLICIFYTICSLSAYITKFTSYLHILHNLLLICIFYTIYSLSVYFTQFTTLYILHNLLPICVFYTIYSLSAYFTQFTPYLHILHNLLLICIFYTIYSVSNQNLLKNFQATEEKIEMTALQNNNKQILCNLLPAHVAAHFIDNQNKSHMVRFLWNQKMSCTWTSECWINVESNKHL